jgi:hypothetical protein
MRKFLVNILESLGLKVPITLGFDVLKLSLGFGVFSVARTTPAYSYQSLVRIFCATRGHSNDFFSRWISLFRRPVAIKTGPGIVGSLDESGLDKITEKMNSLGFHVFEKKLTPEFCDRIVEFSCRTTSVVLADVFDPNSKEPPRVAQYDPKKLVGTRYDYRTQDLLNSPDIQKLLGDPDLLRVAQAYLGSLPILDIIGLWWNTTYSDQPNKNAAQYFHFDMDRIKWLKFFFYFTDVGPENGPHVFVMGSHRTNKIPKALLKQGYARLTDEEVAQYYPSSKFVEFTGSRGTVLAEDTRGLHKGKNLQSGARLILSVQFSNSLFGANVGHGHFDKIYDPQLKKQIDAYPGIYRHFLK